MSKLIFTELNFHITMPDNNPALNETERVLACKAAQRVFDDWLASQPTVYGSTRDGFYWHKPDPASGDTHSAKLVAIQEIKKEKCEHYPHIKQDGSRGIFMPIAPTCIHCGRTLKSTGWVEVE